jgi:hypothetical protein
MAIVKFAGEERDIDQQLKEAADVAPTDPIKIRLQPQIFQAGEGYQAWKRLSWVLQFKDVEAVVAFRERLSAFMVAQGEQ